MIHDDIDQILSGLIIDGRQIPSCPLRYRGKAEQYIIWTIISETPQSASDDSWDISAIEIDVDIYSTAGYYDIYDAVIDLFTAAGWVWTDSGPEMYEEDTGYFHRTVTFQHERMK